MCNQRPETMAKVKEFKVVVRVEPTSEPTASQVEAHREFWKRVFSGIDVKAGAKNGE